MALRQLIPLAVQTVRDPREAARSLLQIGLPVQHYWTAFLAVTCLAAAVVQGMLLIDPPPETILLDDGTEIPVRTPGALQTVALIGGGLLIIAGLLHLGARAFGGRGRFAEMVLASTWAQAVLIGLNLLALPFLLVGLAGLVEVALFVGLFWIMGGLTAGIHGFESTGKVVMGVIGGIFALALGLAILVVALGGGGGGL